MEETYIYEPIDLEECFDPVFKPPEDFLEECQKHHDENPSPFTTVVERKIGNTWYRIETICDGTERLIRKVKRLIFEDKGEIC